MLGVGLLCLHLSHGASSMFQSLGWKNKAWAPLLNCSSRAVAILIFLGYISIPAAILLARKDHQVTPMPLDSKIPSGPLAQKWDKHKFDLKLVNPANKRKYEVLVVGSGLAGASAAATLAELGYQVKCFCFQDSAAPGSQYRRPGRHQRRQELPE